MSDAWHSIAAEFLGLYPKGRRLLAVAGADPGRSRLAADDVALALDARGEVVERTHTADDDDGLLRSDVVAPFRAGAADDRVLVVSGPGALLDPRIRGLWHFTVWQFAGDEPPETTASALVDVSDPAHPARRLVDYC